MTQPGVNISYSQKAAANEAARCLLCHDAPCTKACPAGKDPARFIRSIRFENMKGAAYKSIDSSLNTCDKSCKENKPCQEACLRKYMDTPIQIGKLERFISDYGTLQCLQKKILKKQADLSIDFLGIHCENPFFLSSSVVSNNYDMCAKALESGWSGVAFKTVGTFVPKDVSPRFDILRKEGTPFVGFKNIEEISDHSLEENLEWMRRLKQDFPSKVLVASIMGQNEEEWTYLAKAVTEAGADIIECNFSCPHMSDDSLGSDTGQNPELVRRYTSAVRRGTSLPILAKMTPNIGNMEIPAIAAIQAGADGIAAINTIKSITNIDLDTAAAYPSINGKSSVSGYSGKAVKPIALRFIHDLAKCPQLEGVPISGMGGIETWRDAVEFLLLGASNIQITTSVMQYGYGIIEDLIDGLSIYMEEKGYEHVSDMVGLALRNMVPTDQLDRDTIVYPIVNKLDCIGCGRCYISCYDAGHQAIRWNDAERLPHLAAKKCVGCHLCLHVCPAGAIGAGKRMPKPQAVHSG